MIPPPLLRPGVAILPMEGGIELRLGDETILVLKTGAPDRVLQILARWAQHSRGTAEEAELAAQDLALSQQLAEELSRAGLLAESPVDVRDPVATYLANASGSKHPGQALRSARVGLTGHAPGVALMLGILEEHGIQAHAVSEAPNSVSLDAMVCLCEKPDLTLLSRANQAAQTAQRPCLFVDLSHGRHATIGPFFIPQDGACYQCFRLRLHENTAAYAELRVAEARMLSTQTPLPGYGVLPAHRYLVAGIAAAELVAYFERHRPLRTLNRAITIALDQAEMWTEPVWRIPWCPVCGSAPGLGPS